MRQIPSLRKLPVISRSCSDMPKSNINNPLALENQLCFALYSANRAMTALYRPLLEPLELTYPQYLTFLVLWDLHKKNELPCKVTLISNTLGLDTGTLTPLLKRMEAKGWLVRKRLLTDERVVGVDLTDAGLRLKGKAQEIPAKLACMVGLEFSAIADLKVSVEQLTLSLRNAGVD